MGWMDIFSNPKFGAILSGAAQGQTSERDQSNAYGNSTNRALADIYGTRQGALLSSLLAQDRGAMDRYGTQQQATTQATAGRQGATSHALDAQSAEGLNRSELGMRSGTVRARQSLLGSMMKNMQPATIQAPAGQRGHESTITGGLNASAIDPTTRQHGDLLMNTALDAQRTGSDVPAATDFMGGVQDWDKTVLTPPPATDYSKGLIDPPDLQGYQGAGKGESLLAGGGILAKIIQAILGGGGLPGGSKGGTTTDPVNGASEWPRGTYAFGDPYSQFGNATQPGAGQSGPRGGTGRVEDFWDWTIKP